jgi:type VI protein secretion system component Hcp
MKNLRGPIVFIVLLCAVPCFAAVDAFIWFERVNGESSDAAHRGWVEVASFSWGVSNPTGAAAIYTGPQGCATNEIRFGVRGAAAPQLLKLQGAHLSPVKLDAGGQHHVLEGATIASCQNNLSPNGQQTANCVMRFQRCSVHANATSNASLVPAVNRVAIGGQGSDATIIAVHPGGANNVTLKLRGGSSLVQSCATGHHIKQAVITCRKAGGTQQEFMTFTLTDVVISTYQAMGDGSVQISMTYASHAGIVPEMQ